MSLFNDRSDSSNPLSKKPKKNVAEQIDKLTNFYNALSDDTNMSYVINELDIIHDAQVAISEQITLLNEELHAFELKFTDQIDYSDTSITAIRDKAVSSIEKVISSEVAKDVKEVKKRVERLKSSAVDDLYQTVDEVKKKISQNNSIIIDAKQEKKSVNWTGGILLTGCALIFMLEIVFLLDSVSANKQIKEHSKALKYLSAESDERFEDIKGAIFELREK